MRKWTAVFVIAGVAAVGVALWLWKQARDDYDQTQRICALGGDPNCSAAMTWWPTVTAVAVAVVLFLVARRSAQS